MLFSLCDSCYKFKFNVCSKQFLANSEINLETQLKEFTSHSICRMSEDRTIRFTVDPAVLGKFMEDKLSE